MHVGTIPLLLYASSLTWRTTNAFPAESSVSSSPSAAVPVGRLAFSLADEPVPPPPSSAPSTSFMDIITTIAQSEMFQKVVKYIGGVVTGQKDEAKKPVTAATPQADLPSLEKAHFEASLSHDEAVETVPSAGAAVGGHGIKDQAFTNLLFGEQGVLTNVFHMLDAQKTNEMAQKAQADPASNKIQNLDFAKVFDSLLMGGSKQNEFGQPGPELPEFLGICNRLSCGDIYKAIDEFRRSEFFSNFQTALQLIQDPKGWDIMGKMLSNPELIASFTGGAGGGAIGEMLGSAFGSAKEKTDKEKSFLMSGDYGTDFSEGAIVDGKEEKPKLPETSFSVDAGGKGKGMGEDYYKDVVKSINEDFDADGIEEETVEKVETIPTPPPLITTTTTTTATVNTTTALPSTNNSSSITFYTAPAAKTTTREASKREEKKEEAPLPEISFSIDQDYTEEGATFEKTVDAVPPSFAISKNIDVVPPTVLVDQKPPLTTAFEITPVRSTSAVPSEFTENVDVAPPSPATSTVSPAKRGAVMGVDHTQGLVIFGGRGTQHNKTTLPFRSTTQLQTTTNTLTPALSTSPPSPPTTAPPSTSSPPSTTRPMKRVSMTLQRSTARPTTVRNYRKDSDYYAMYYDS